MHRKHRRGFFGVGILFLFVLAMTLAGRGLAEAAVISVTPANVKAAADRANEGKAAGAADRVKTIQDVLEEDATYAGDEDILNFAPGEYRDAGELLITRAITLRKDPAAGGRVVFKGKVLINVKADDVVVEGLEFMDVTVPDAVTMTVDRDPDTDGDQTVVYGFPGKTIKQMLADDGFTGLDTRELVASYLAPRLDLGNPAYDSFYDWSDRMFITVAGSSTPSDNGRVANRESGLPIDGARDSGAQTASTTPYEIDESVVAGRAKGVLGVIWVDSTVADGASCRTSAGAHPAELPQIKGVVIRNNAFNGTETAGVRAGSMKTLVVTDATRCRVQLDIIGNSFSNIGGTGGFVKARNAGADPPDATDADGNRIAEPGNVAPAISVARPAGTAAAKTRILSNTITGGLGDGIELRWTPTGQKVDIRNNLLTDTPLDGITVIGTSFSPADATTDISVAGNRIIGTSDNRYLTMMHSALLPSTNPVFYGRHFIIHGPRNYPNVWTLSGSGGGGCVGGAALIPESGVPWNTPAQKELRRAVIERVKMELWRSPVPETYDYAVKFPRGVSSLPAYSSEAGDVLDSGSRYADVGTADGMVAGRFAVYRIAADRCFDLARIKVYDQAGVSVTGNDLGYNPPGDAGDVIDYGIVIDGAATMKLKALSGNNIDLASVSSIKNNGASLSVAGNYFGSGEPTFSGTVTGRDDVSSGPLETMAGPRAADIGPDAAAPATMPGGGGCALASAESAGDGTSVTFLPLMLAGLAFVLRRRAVAD